MDPQAVIIIFVAIALGALIKGVTGSGLPQIAIPVMAIFLGVERSVVIMAIPGIVSNAWLIWRFRGHFGRTRDLPTLLTTGVIGAVGGTWLLKALDPRILSGVLALIILVYLVVRQTRPEFELSPTATRRLSPPVGLAAGTLQGATGISGPLVTTWLHSYRLDPPVYIVSLVTLFQVFGTVQAITLVGLGLFTPTRVLEGLLALVPMVIALPIGARLATRMSPKTFDVWIVLLLLGSAGKLAHSAIWG
ncbi:sulfite exporter TauE/SafE family protein [Egicoccus sp. AB-alg6-2]|uniref:sulfite exporter TauE/SafE family protein n=1 Tax=Egicoccus sp. AB-alg6-2 TaxID=3242692 RepID=UPI00359D1A19